MTITNVGMRVSKAWRVALLVLATTLCLPVTGLAQASLAAEDIIDEVPVKIGNVVERSLRQTYPRAPARLVRSKPRTA